MRGAHGRESDAWWSISHLIVLCPGAVRRPTVGPLPDTGDVATPGYGVNSVEESEDTHCGPKLQKCAHVLLYAGNVRNAARVRIRLANWVVRAAMRV